MTHRKHKVKQRTAVLTLLSCLVVGCTDTVPVVSDKPLIRRSPSAEELTKLPVEVRALWNRIVNGSLLGINADSLQSVLSLADEKRNGNQQTSYHFSLVRKKTPDEGDYSIFVVVHNSSNIVTSCGLAEWCT